MRRILHESLPAVIVVLLIVLPCLGQKPDKPLFDYREITLDNGLRVVTLEDFSCPIVNVNLWYHVGSKNEDPERQGFAHMFEHMMFRGTDRLGPTDHFDFIRRSGGTCNAYTSFDQTVYLETVPASQLEMALWLEAERMTFLKIDQESFDTERKVVEEERRMGLSQPYGTMLEKALDEIFRVHPYRWSPIGNIPHLRSTSTAELRSFWTRFYVPNNATLVIVGAVKHADAQKLARKCFAWIPRYPDAGIITTREPMPTQRRSITIKEDNAPTPLVGVVYRTVAVAHDDAMLLDLLGTILGGGQSSRLYRELVADRELAVFAGAGTFALEHEGLFAAGAALSPFGGKTDKVIGAIEAQVERLRNEPVAERELTKARNQMLKGIVTESLTIASKASALGSAAVLEGDVARVNERLAQIAKVTPADLQHAAQKYLVPEHALVGKVERNLLGTLGSLFWKRKDAEEAPITAQPETDPPPPGRPGLSRPEKFPDKPPVAGLLAADPTPKFEATTLGTGLKVMVVENHEVPFVTVKLGLRAGAWTEAKPGTAFMTLNMLTKGTASHDEGALADELETYAISLTGNGGMDSSSVQLNCLTEHIDRAMGLLAEVVQTPTFSPDEFRKLRKQTITGLTIASAEPSYKADRELRRRLYGDHPYSRTETGEIEDVNALTIEDCSTWWKAFARPDMGTLIFAGDIDLQRAVDLAKAHFSAWTAEGSPPEVTLPPIPEAASTHIYLVDHPGVQSQLRIGQRGITRQHADYFTSRVVTDYFGGSFGSRLNETIRVEKGLTYGAGGGYSTRRLAGEFRIGTFSKTESTVEAIKALLEEVQRLAAEPPSANELERTKSYTVGSFPAKRETPQAVARDLWLIESYDLPNDYFERLLKKVAATSAEDCVNLVQKTIDPSKMVVVVIGAAKELRSQLEEIAPVTVVDPGATPAKTDTETPNA